MILVIHFILVSVFVQVEAFNSDANEYFHSNRNNPDLRKAVEDQRGIFSGWNYGIGIQVDP